MVLLGDDPGDGSPNVGGMHVFADGFQSRKHGPGSIHIVHAPAAIPWPGLLLFLLQKADGPRGCRIRAIITQRAQHLEFSSGHIRGAGIQERAVIGKWDVIEKHPVVVSVVGAPAAVASLHGQGPAQSAPHRLIHILLGVHFDFGKRDHDRSRIVIVRIGFILKLKIPAARLRLGRRDNPVPDFFTLA